MFVPAVNPLRTVSFPAGGGAPHAATAASTAPAMRGAAAVTRSLPAPGAVPAPHVPGSGGRGSGGGHASSGAGDAIAAAAAIVIVVGLIAAIAASSEPPPPFDGWVDVSCDHPLHLDYGRGVERVVKLKDLRSSDLVGLRDTILKDNEGSVVRARPASGPATVATRQ